MFSIGVWLQKCIESRKGQIYELNPKVENVLTTLIPFYETDIV